MSQCQLLGLSAALAGLGNPTLAAAAPKVVISVVSTSDGQGVKSRIWRREGTSETETSTDEKGTKAFDVPCKSNVSFKVRPLSPLYVYPTGWQPCETNLVVKLRPVGFADSIGQLLSQEPAQLAQLAPDASTATRVNVLQTELQSALASGQWGSLAFYANELAATFRSIDKVEVANLFSATAIESGGRAISAAQGSDLSSPLVVTYGNNIPVESQAANQVLRDFQAHQNLSTTGRWDYQTFRAVRGLDATLGVANNPSSNRP
jgi:hypothetical protein